MEPLDLLDSTGEALLRSQFQGLAQTYLRIGWRGLTNRSWRVYAAARRADRPAVLRLVHYRNGFLSGRFSGLLLFEEGR